MSRSYKVRNQQSLYFVSFATVNWIDVFTRREYRDIFVESLQFCIKHKGLEVYAWCLMSNHVHLIIGSTGEKLENILRDLKRHTSKELTKAIEENSRESRRAWMLWMFERAGTKNPNNTKYQFWQQQNHPIELSSNVMVEQRLEYLHQNPVVAGWVEEPEHYLYSSARDYAGLKGLVEVLLVE
ncbi:transposase [Rufibacter glacialis]|uniref:Transposase n=1 Tax=Rufibacter glacialis TaxID=1259555 RepID=A0A5M8QDW7_9BACT|nr:transposase [Rufibacter glacialis]KAA6433203.1 transposase [Rufibacter glacialis]GGK76514.1 transposase [Rufibacter glacialis]